MNSASTRCAAICVKAGVFRRGAGLEGQQHHAQRLGGVAQRSPIGRQIAVRRVPQHGHARGARQHLLQQLEPLRRQLGRQLLLAGDVAARTREAGDDTGGDHVFGAGSDDDRDRPRRLSDDVQHCPADGDDNHIGRRGNQLGSRDRHAFGAAFGAAHLDEEVAAFDLPMFGHAGQKLPQERDVARRAGVGNPRHADPRQLVRRRLREGRWRQGQDAQRKRESGGKRSQLHVSLRRSATAASIVACARTDRNAGRCCGGAVLGAGVAAGTRRSSLAAVLSARGWRRGWPSAGGAAAPPRR
jgi:hypothetical protein